MPSPASHSFSDTLPGDHATQTDTIRSDNSILITDRSLTDMLASNTVQSDSQLPDNINESQDEIIRLESKLLASEIELQYEKKWATISPMSGWTLNEGNRWFQKNW